MPKGFKEDIEKQLCAYVAEEFSKAKSNRDYFAQDYESYLDLIDSIRSERDYDWMSDIKIPEFTSHVITQASMDASVTFRTRDFVEVYLEDSSDSAVKSAGAVKECINRTLNRRDLNFFQKRVRAGIINQLAGHIYAECRWCQEKKQVQLGTFPVPKDPEFDIKTMIEQGLPFNPEEIELEDMPIYGDQYVKDQFELDILDPRNVFPLGNRYAYSVQEMPGIIIRCEKSLEDLKRETYQAGYFNLDKLEEMKADGETDTSKETFNLSQQQAPIFGKIHKMFDIIKRKGWMWCIVKERDPETDLPTKIEPGFDENGEVKDKAEMHLIEMELAYADGKYVLIAFHPTPYLDYRGQPYINIIRGLCYIHPSEDGGFGDAKHCKDLQTGLDDTINMSNDRTKLATFPMFQVKKFSVEDNDTLYIEPGHMMQVNDVGDIQEFKISDNIQGSMTQAAFFIDKMQQFDAIFPSTMGRVPVAASTTATAVAGAEQRTDMRANFKNMTFTNTFDADMYWMIIQQTYQFAQPQTGYKLMGDKVFDFDPSREYWYKPVAQAIESEQSKQMKTQRLREILQTVVPLAPVYGNQPNFMSFVNLLLMRMAEYMGEESANVAKILLDPKIKPMLEGGEGQIPQQGGIPSFGGATNQTGLPQTGDEVMARQGAGGTNY